MKSTYYFSHDSNARHDIKIQALRSVHGVAGYGKYWIIIEMMRESAGYKLKLNNKVLLIALSREFECSADEVKNFINDCIYDFGLFICDDDFFWSDSLVQRMELAEIKRNASKQNGFKGGRPRKDAHEQPQEAREDSEPEPDKPKRQKRVTGENATIAQEQPEKTFSEDVIILTGLLVDRIKANNPNAKVSDINKWRDAIRLMIDSDGYNYEQIYKMIEFSQSDEFWKSNILSSKKLREKAGTLVLQMRRESGDKIRGSKQGINRPDIAPKRIPDDNLSPERIAEILEAGRKYEEELRNMSG